ncbi:MAG: putative molybdenum carrier protein [Candidatus Hydrogenedentes bacterium]|nr:putative molybdenum carrier protein [Candidatus Hydrogenedentota bacterium]
MLRRIVSGGQTGVDRAALDVAMSLGIRCGGWCPSGRLAEDGVIPPGYPMVETPFAEYEVRTFLNVRDSDGTLVLTFGPPANGTAYTIDCVVRLGKPFLVVDLDQQEDPKPVRSWLNEHRITVLNIAGPRASKVPRAYDGALRFLLTVLSEGRQF